MRLAVAVVAWLYHALAGMCMLFVVLVFSSLVFQLPFNRQDISLKMTQWVSDPSGRLAMGVLALLLGVVFFFFLYTRARMARQEPSIAFDNPDGEVSISVRAIEDFVGRIGRDFAEVKSLEPSIVARREGVYIVLKTELWSGTNIPKLTERIQNVIKSQVQNILGIENVQAVTMSVSKIIARDREYQMPSQPDIFAGQGQGQEGNREISSDVPNIPYQG